MAEYIERESTLQRMKVDIRSPFAVVADMPAADVCPVRHGRWIIDGVYVVCSICNRLTLSPIVKQLPTFTYCPNCGARMDLEVMDTWQK